MKKILLHIILNSAFLILHSFCFAQNKNIDSLLALLKNDKSDTTKAKHLNSLGWELKEQNPDTAIILGNMALDIITPLSSSEFTSTIGNLEPKEIRSIRAKTLGYLGVYYWLKANYIKALDFLFQSLKMLEELGDKNRIASGLGNIANVFLNKGDYPKALDYYFKALKIFEELHDKNGIARQFANIGIIYKKQSDYSKAMAYYSKALMMYEELKNKSEISKTLGNLGNVYADQGDLLKALDYYFKALKLAEELGEKDEIASNLCTIGTVYHEQKDYTKALTYYFKALKTSEEIGDDYNEAITLIDIGLLYTKTGKFIDAERYLKRARTIVISTGAMEELRLAEESLSQLYDTTRRYKDALIHYKNAIALKDTLFSQENKKQIVRKEMNFEFEKKEAATKATHDKEMAVAEAEKKKQQFILLLVSCFLLLVFLFAGFVFRSLRITRKQKNIIELQKNEVSLQKEIVEKQKEKIVDSITYAQRIQQSILMEESEIQSYLPECFIYFQPKDIVSGDFYWCSKTDDKIIIAAVDCTGHGVPGAFMSMIGNTLLNQIVNEKHITKPSEILKLLNLGVYEALHQKKEEALSDDGMDIALCAIDYKNNELQYAGAQNPLYVLFENQIDIIKADIHGIGGGGMIARIHDRVKKEFTNHVIPIKKGMSIYLFSDGYSDQFGGDRRKRLGTQKFKQLLLSIQPLNMQKQKENLVSAHEEWKGSIVQIDDILVIGIRI